MSTDDPHGSPETLAAAPATAHCAYDYAQVDVFAENPLEGNALAIFSDARGLSTDEMQALARETNLNETTFILPRAPEVERERGVQVRIFLTTEEVPFAGHPTLGTASWLYWNHPILHGAEQITLDLGVGPIPVRFTPSGPSEHGVFGTMKQNDPTFGEIRNSREDREALAAALNLSSDDLDPALPAQIISTGMSFCIVPLKSLDVATRLANLAADLTHVSRSHRRKILSLHHSCSFRFRSRLARPHAVRQGRRSCHRLGLRLHHRLSCAPRSRSQRSTHRHRAGN